MKVLLAIFLALGLFKSLWASEEEKKSINEKIELTRLFHITGIGHEINLYLQPEEMLSLSVISKDLQRLYKKERDSEIDSFHVSDYRTSCKRLWYVTKSNGWRYKKKTTENIAVFGGQILSKSTEQIPALYNLYECAMSDAKLDEKAGQLPKVLVDLSVFSIVNRVLFKLFRSQFRDDSDASYSGTWNTVYSNELDQTVKQLRDQIDQQEWVASWNELWCVESKKVFDKLKNVEDLIKSNMDSINDKPEESSIKTLEPLLMYAYILFQHAVLNIDWQELIDQATDIINNDNAAPINLESLRKIEESSKSKDLRIKFQLRYFHDFILMR